MCVNWDRHGNGEWRWREGGVSTAVGTILVGGDDVLVALGFQPLANAERILDAAQKLGVLRVLVRREEDSQHLLG